MIKDASTSCFLIGFETLKLFLNWANSILYSEFNQSLLILNLSNTFTLK